tara:strand:+ start:338 stop:460 length:123 start_codon:yes stop_codon:yes gene_type:complete
MASVKGGNITNIDASPITKVSSEEAGGKLRYGTTLMKRHL